jgi:hypothetical protein
VIPALVWLAVEAGGGYGGGFAGAFPVVMGLLILFCLHDPKQTIIFIFVPMPVWLLGAIFVGFEVIGVMQGGGAWITPVADLSSSLMAFIYYRAGWNLSSKLPTRWPKLKRPTKLKLHDPEAEERQLARQVDAILEKISRDGEASLSKQERRTLEQASRRYQRKRQ